MLVFAEDHDAPRNLVSSLKRLLQSEAAVAKLDSQTGSPQLARQNQRGRVEAFANRRNIRVSFCRGRGSLRGFLRLQRQHQPVQSHREADSRRLRSANSLAQSVIAAAAEQSVLRTQPTVS